MFRPMAETQTLSALSVPASRSRDAEVVRVTVHATRDTARAAVDALPRDIICSGYQTPAFLRAWLDHSPHRPAFITLTAEGAGPVLLPLERIGANALAYVGERHANGNFPVGRARDIEALAAAGEDAIVAALCAARPDAHAIVLERQLPECRGIANPFIFEGSTVSPNVALSLSLEGGFEAVLSRHSAKRKRKRFRGQERDLEQIGGYTYVPMVDADHVEETMKRCLALKAVHFEAAGINDVFAEDHVQAFFTEIFREGARAEPHSHVLKTIEADGKQIAISACTCHDGRLTVEFSTYDPAYRDYSPGDMLFFLSIREAAENGGEVYDFGVGDELFKRNWCEIETWQRDTIIPLSARGRALAATRSIRNALVRSLKQNKKLWQTAKKIRRAVPIMRLGNRHP